MARTRSGSSSDALCYQLVSRLVDYPDESLTSRLPALAQAARRLPTGQRDGLTAVVDHLRATDPVAAQAAYVETFDMRRRCCLYLSYYAYGDTRKRGMALIAFKSAYRAAGVEMDAAELPDHLCVVLEFAGSVDLTAGRRLLADHRAGLELLCLSLQDAGSPYAGAIAAVSATLPTLRGNEREAIRRLVAEGPPGEQVGLDPFGPPMGRPAVDDQDEQSPAAFFDLASLRVRT